MLRSASRPTYGLSYEGAYPCLLTEALPAGAHVLGGDAPISTGPDPASADSPAAMLITYMPLGIICTVQLAHPTRTAVIGHQSWPATTAWLGLSAIAVLAILLARQIYRAGRGTHTLGPTRPLHLDPRERERAGAITLSPGRMA